MQWTTGDDSDGINGLGGTEALAGINAGDGVNSITIPGSLTPNIINITQTSNVGIPGVWMFKVGEGTLCAYVITCIFVSLCMGKSKGSIIIGLQIWEGNYAAVSWEYGPF